MSRARSSGVVRDRVLAVATLLTLLVVGAFVGPAAAAPLPVLYGEYEVAQEPVAGQPGFVGFTFTVVGEFVEPLSFDYRTMDGTARRGLDYVAKAGTITVRPGTSTGELRIRLKGDDVAEDDETLTLVLSNPVNVTFGGGGNYLATVTDAGNPLVLRVSGSRSYVEPDRGSNINININLSLNRPAPYGLYYELIYADGTAVAFEDYNPSLGSRAFHHSRTNDHIQMQIRGDDLPEGTETFSVTVTADGATVANDTITITILDND